MSNEPNGAMSSSTIYSDVCQQALKSFDKLHPSLKTIEAKEKEKAEMEAKAKQVSVEVKPKRKPDMLNVMTPINEDEVKTFDKELKDELIDILRENKLSIIELNDEKIIFEYKGTKLLFLPI